MPETIPHVLKVLRIPVNQTTNQTAVKPIPINTEMVDHFLDQMRDGITAGFGVSNELREPSLDSLHLKNKLKKIVRLRFFPSGRIQDFSRPQTSHEVH